jgi:class 3 adenylate cyclase/tetratricopeptide (TPR) repeat protein
MVTVVNGWSGAVTNGDVDPERSASIDALIDSAVSAINRGDRATASALAGQVLAVDTGNADAEDLLAAPGDVGEIRRLTLLFADLVDSTALSTRVEPEIYRSVVGRYREQVRLVVAGYEGHIGLVAGDGVLAAFGYPVAHEDDARRAVRAGLEIVADVTRISAQARRRFGIEINVRVGIHRGLVYLDTAEGDVYGLAANLAARVSGLAPSGSVVLSAAVEPLVRNDFDIERCEAAPVKGVQGLIVHCRVIEERVHPARPILGPLVGRSSECRRLRENWQAVRAGAATPALLFRGEPGIGKSRLAAEAVDLVTSSDAVVLELAGSPHHTDVGLHPIRVLLEQRCGIGRRTEPGERLRLLDAEVRARGLDPATSVPALATVLAIAPEHGYEPLRAEGHRLEELIVATARSYLLACCGAAPALLVAEDLQWFDRSTMDLVGSMVGATDDRVLVVLTGRDGDWLPAGWLVDSFDLAPLSDQQTDELIGSIDPTLSDTERAEVRRRCDGVPFYIEQVVGGLHLTSADGPQVPDALYEPLFARLRPGDNVVPVAEAAAVIGRHVDRPLLLAVVDLDEAQVDEVLDQLADAWVLEQLGSGDWRFRHELLRELATELAPPSVRQGLHARVADALVDGASGDPDWPLVATHYDQAGRHLDAAAAYRRASGAARQRGALAEARAYLTHAVAQVQQSPPGIDRDRLEIAPRLERGYLIATAEGPQSPLAAADFERCLQLAGTDLRNDDVFAALLAVGAYYIWRADLRRAGQVGMILQADAEPGRRSLRPAIDGSSGIVAWLRGDFDTARTHFEQATANLSEGYERRLQTLWFVPHDPVALAHEHLAWDHNIRGDLAGAEQELKRAVERTNTLGYPQRPYNHLYALNMEIWVRTEAGQYHRARALVGELTQKADDYGLDHLYWQLLGATERAMVDACAALASTDLDGTVLPRHIASLTQIVDMWQALGASTLRPFYWCVLGRLLAAAGQLEPARARIDGALNFAADTSVRFYNAELLRARSHTQIEPTARAADLAAARDVAVRQGAWLFELRAGLDDFELRGDPARDHLAEAVAKAPSDCDLPELRRARAALSDSGGVT